MEKIKKLWPLVFFFFLVGCFFWPLVFQGRVPFPGDLLVGYYAPFNSEFGLPHKAQGVDVIRQLYPWKTLTIDSLKQGELPFWNPYAFSGNLHLANFQTAVFYPGNLFLFFLSQIDAWTTLVVSQFLFSGLFLYLFLRKIKISAPAALLGAVSFAFSSFMVVWSQWNTLGQAALFLPLALLALEHLREKISWPWWLVLIGSLTFSFFAGHLQTSLYVYFVVGAYFLFKTRREGSGKGRGAFFLAVLVVFLLTAVQWLPTVEFYLQSPRASVSADYIFDRSLLFFPSLMTLFAPDFFGNPATRNYFGSQTYIEQVSYFGAIPLFLAFLALFLLKKREVRFWGGAGFLALVLAVNNPLARAFYNLNLPVLGTSTPTRILFLVSFSGSVLAAFGLDAVLKDKKRSFKKYLWPILLGGGVYLGGGIWALSTKNLVSLRNSVIPGASFLLVVSYLIFRSRLKNDRLIKFLPLGLVLVTFGDLFYHGQKMTPFVSRELVFPQMEVLSFLKEEGGINRLFGFEDGYVDTNFATQYSLFSPEGYDPLFISRYGELVRVAEGGNWEEEIPRSDVNLPKVYPAATFPENPGRRRLFQLLGIKYILDREDMPASDFDQAAHKFDPQIFKLIWQRGKWKVYEYQEALPRAFLVRDYLVEKDPKQIIRILYDGGFCLGERLVLEEDLPSGFELSKGERGKVTVVDYRSNRVVFQTRSEGRELLFLSDNFYPGWEAFVDGQKTDLYRADYTFRAVPVPGGDHEIVFAYQSPSFKTGAIVSGLTLAGLVLFFGIGNKLLRKGKEQ